VTCLKCGECGIKDTQGHKRVCPGKPTTPEQRARVVLREFSRFGSLEEHEAVRRIADAIREAERDLAQRLIDSASMEEDNCTEWLWEEVYRLAQPSTNEASNGTN
jgi:hypothetical protein